MIASRQNKQVKQWIKLKHKKYRDQQGRFLVYGKHLIEKAKASHALIDIITDNPDKEGILVSSEIMKDLQQTVTYIDQIGVCKMVNDYIESAAILILDDVQDPDNVGALMRSAAAFGFNHLVLSLGCADMYNEKVIRASKGALFDCFIERKPLDKAFLEIKEKGYFVVGADAHQTGSISKQNKIAVVLGNEGHGISDEIKPYIDQYVTIQTKNVESLNVSVAGAIIMRDWSLLS